MTASRAKPGSRFVRAQSPAGRAPRVAPDAFVHPSAQLIGNVRVGPRVFVGPCAVLRADEPGADGRVKPIVIGTECNLQDGVILHALGGSGVAMGRGVSVAHGAVVHGPCRLGNGCFIGFRAVVFDAVLGDGVCVGTGAVVQSVRLPAGVFVPPGAVVLSDGDVRRLGKTGPKHRRFMKAVVRTNVRLARGYLKLEGSAELESIQHS